MSRRKRHTPLEIVAKLREADVELDKAILSEAIDHLGKP